MNQVEKLIDAVGTARQSYLNQMESVSEELAMWKPSSDVWNVVEITEHLYWAEHGGILGMWKTLHAIRSSKMERVLESKHKGLSVEAIVQRTWKEKEQVPAVAAPRLGGTAIFWKHALQSLQSVLTSFGNDLQPEELHILAHPHPISGPMDFHQRLEFLAFHIKRHEGQVKNLLLEVSKR